MHAMHQNQQNPDMIMHRKNILKFSSFQSKTTPYIMPRATPPNPELHQEMASLTLGSCSEKPWRRPGAAGSCRLNKDAIPLEFWV